MCRKACCLESGSLLGQKKMGEKVEEEFKESYSFETPFPFKNVLLILRVTVHDPGNKVPFGMNLAS